MLRRFLAVAGLLVLPALTVAEDFPLNGSNTDIKFVGSKPQGKHDGGFKTVSGTASVSGDATSLKLTLDIDMDSLYSDNNKLTTHLKSPDFFGVKSNPKGKFESTKVEKANSGYKITGDLTMLGKKVTVSFPAKIDATPTSLTITSDFSIDRTKWGMTYGQGKINDEVKLSVSVKAKK